MKIHNNQKALAGEFAVLSQLALRGYDANMTLGNTKKVDILISNPKTENMYKLEVKTTTMLPSSPKGLFGRTLSWMMREQHEQTRDTNLFYCFVNIDVKSSQFRFFVVPSKAVADYVKKEFKYWMKADPRHKVSSMRTFRLGFRDIKYKFSSTLFMHDFENKWDLLK